MQECLTAVSKGYPSGSDTLLATGTHSQLDITMFSCVAGPQTQGTHHVPAHAAAPFLCL
jgi:hypothetical protein